METSKFHELCGAYGRAQDLFENYKTDCHVFSMEIVKRFKEDYQVPDSQFSLYKITEQQEFNLVTPALIHAIDLKEDNYWHFGIGITVCKTAETLPEELILIHLMFRKNEKEQYFIKYANEDEEFEIKRNDDASYSPFFDFLYSIMLNSYKSSLQRFVGVKTERKLGYLN